MSNHTVISVENLGKVYSISHQKERQRYVTLRDIAGEKLKQILHFDLRDPTKSKSEDFWALRDISFDVKQGDVVGIIGRNGAGKSTLLKILSRITEPSEGRVRIKGRVASLLEVGTGFHPELTGRENIQLNGAILGMSRQEIRKRFDEIVAFSEVEKFLDTAVKHYSSGMYVRLAFAVAAHLEPEILVVDEVLAVGDSQFQNKCLGKMQQVSKGGRTILFVSHNMAAVQSLCGKGLLLEHGKLSTTGPIGPVMRQYSASIRREVNEDHIVDLGPSLKLLHLKTEPPYPKSGCPMSISIQFVANKPTVIQELAVLIYSELGVRVAILDLRDENIRNVIVHDDPVSFAIDLAAMPLVEGEYRLGLYINTNDHHANFLDLTVFTVAPIESHSTVIPYLPQSRGLVEIGFSVRRHFAGKCHLSDESDARLLNCRCKF